MKLYFKKLKLFIKRWFKFDQSWVGFTQHHFYILKSKVLSHYNNLRDFAKESLFKSSTTYLDSGKRFFCGFSRIFVTARHLRFKNTKVVLDEFKISGASALGFTPHRLFKTFVPRTSGRGIQNSKLKTQKCSAGFTIMETIMVLGVFTIATTYALAIFVQSNTVQKRTANIQRTLVDARYVMEVMAREFRMGQIDYDYYGGPLPSPAAELYLLDINNNPVRFRRFVNEQSGNGTVQLFFGGNWLDVTPPDLNISRLDFYLSPPEDPFVWNGSGYNSNQQPALTIILTSKSLHQEGGLLQDPREGHFQTTVTSRKYVR